MQKKQLPSTSGYGIVSNADTSNHIGSTCYNAPWRQKVDRGIKGRRNTYFEQKMYCKSPRRRGRLRTPMCMVCHALNMWRH